MSVYKDPVGKLGDIYNYCDSIGLVLVGVRPQRVSFLDDDGTTLRRKRRVLPSIRFNRPVNAIDLLFVNETIIFGECSARQFVAFLNFCWMYQYPDLAFRLIDRHHQLLKDHKEVGQIDRLVHQVGLCVGHCSHRTKTQILVVS